MTRYGRAIEADLAFHGYQLGVLWRDRTRWRLLLNLIDHLPSTSFYAEAVSQDDDAARTYWRQREVFGEEQAAGPRLSDFSPEMAVLTRIYDRLGDLIVSLARVNGQQGPRFEPHPRPVVASDRVRPNVLRQRHLSVVRRLLGENT